MRVTAAARIAELIEDLDELSAGLNAHPEVGNNAILANALRRRCQAAGTSSRTARPAVPVWTRPSRTTLTPS